MIFDSYWLATASAVSRKDDSLSLPARADVVIVGGGFTGLSAARSLARAGATVVVLEAGRLFGGASGRNGGQCNNGLAVDFPSLAARLGQRDAVALYRAFDDAVDSVERIVRQDAIACDFLRNGKLKLAAKPAHFETMKGAVERLVREVEPEAQLLDAKAVAAETGTDAFHGGLLYPRSASMHVGRFGAGLAEAAMRHGAVLAEDAAVLSLERLGARRHLVHSTVGTIDAGAVLVATGASAIAPMRYLRRRIVPIGSFIIVTEPLDPTRAGTVMQGRRNCTTTRHVGHYFRMVEQRRLLFGGRARFALSGRESDEKSGRILVDTLHRLFPVLAGVRAAYCWGGIVDMTQDRLPRAGEHDGLFYAAGYSGHGVQMAVHMGGIMAEVIRGRPERNPLRALDWPAIPGHLGRPWFLPAIGAYYRARDLVE